MRLLENARNAHLYKDPNTEEYKKEAQKERNKIEAEQMKVLT